jgi:hypothetical protein
MMKSRLLAAALVLSAAAATPALAQWETSEPAVFQAQYPNGEPGFSPAGPRDAMAAQMPTRPQRHMMMHAPSAKRH